jgi:Na+/H+ antiporter NhaD/arsenite permease-like protein
MFGLLIAGVIYTAVKTSDEELIISMLKAVDFETISLLSGLFLIIGAISHMGIIDAVAMLLAKLGGGNCTSIGTSANTSGIGILRKAGYEVQTKNFICIGISFTLATVIPAYIYLLYA